MVDLQLAEQMFAELPLPGPVQTLLVDALPQLRTAAAKNPYGLRSDVWRACFAGAPSKLATTLAAGPGVTAADVAWALAERRERRTGPVAALLRNWQLTAAQQRALVTPSVPRNLDGTLANDTGLLPEVRLRAAGQLPATWRLNMLREATLDADDQTVFDIVADVESWPVPEPQSAAQGEEKQRQRDTKRADMLQTAAGKLAQLAHPRPVLAKLFAGSGVVTLAVAAAAAARPSDAAERVLHTCTAALDDAVRGPVAVAGLLSLADRPDTDPSVRAAAVAALLAHDGGRALARAGVAGPAGAPVTAPVAELTAAELELLVLTHPLDSGNPVVIARALLLTELVDAPAADELIARRVLAALGDGWRLPAGHGWLARLLDRFPQLAEAATSAQRSAERAEQAEATTREAWAAALSNTAAVRRRQLDVRQPRPVLAERAEEKASEAVLYNSQRAVEARAALGALLGDDPGAWLLAMRIGDSFAGTVAELAATAHAAAGQPAG